MTSRVDINPLKPRIITPIQNPDPLIKARAKDPPERIGFILTRKPNPNKTQTSAIMDEPVIRESPTISGDMARIRDAAAAGQRPIFSRNRKGTNTIHAPKTACQKRARKFDAKNRKKSIQVSPTPAIRGPNFTANRCAAAKA